MTVEIRPLGIKDAEAAAAMEQEIFGTPWSLGAVEETIARAEASKPGAALVHGAFGAYADGSLAGYLFSMAVAGEGELHRIAVLSAYRRCGIADELMKQFFLWLKENSCESAFLEVRAGNCAAAALYRKHGFSECGRRKAYYRNPTEDALLFRYH